MIYTYNKNKSLGKLYIGSFDFEGAFDSCDFELLIEHVKSQGVGGKLLNVISAIYTNPQSKIYINGTLSEQYPIKRGVAQGCKLSTILFNIYINSLLVELSQDTNIDDENSLSLTTALCFADDLVILSPSPIKFQKNINKIEEWWDKNGVSVNLKKSKILVVNKSKEEKCFTFKGSKIDITDELKYLGFTITKSGSWNTHIQNCLNKTYGLT